jgi:hypothetical protein
MQLNLEEMRSKRNKPSTNGDDRRRNDALNKERGDADKKLPGDYPPTEDIMNRLNTSRVGMNVEDFSRAVGTENFNIDEPATTNPDDVQEDPLPPGENPEDRRERLGMEHPAPNAAEESDLDVTETNESDVTEEDLQALGPKDLSMDMGEDEQLLKNRVWPVDMAAQDLDVPGAELDDPSESIGSEDEENNPYSLGGDAHEDNLEGK